MATVMATAMATVHVCSQPESSDQVAGRGRAGLAPGFLAGAGLPGPGGTQKSPEQQVPGQSPPGAREEALGKPKVSGRSAALRPGPGHGCRGAPGAAAARGGAELRLLPAALRGPGAAPGLRPQLLPALRPPVLQGEAARRLPALPGGLRAEGPAAQPGAGRFGEPGPARGKGRRVGSTG